MTQPATTFALLRSHCACESGYRKLARHLGGVTRYGRDKPIRLTVILEHNGLDDALWCLRALVEPWDHKARLFAVDCAARLKSDDYLYIKDAWYAADLASCKARTAAWYAGGADRYTAEAAERDWQANRLLQYLTGRARPLKRAA